MNATNRNAARTSADNEQRMQCMEVWGGSQLTDQTVAFSGLDAWVSSKPYGGASHGGDVYYASSCGTGRITRLLLADVSGHGSAVASTAADLRTLMRRFVNRIDQTEFVRLLNKQFSEMSKAGTFATAVVTTFFAPTRRLTICNAGHPCPLLYRAADGSWSSLEHKAKRGPMPANTPLGLLSFAEYDQFDIELAPGDVFLSYTDALMESNEADGEPLGESGVLKIARLLTGPGDPPDPATFCPALLQEIRQRYPGNLDDDDVTVLAVRANGREYRHGPAAQFRALGRFLRTLFSAERAPFPDFSLANMPGAILPALERTWRARRQK